MLEQRSKLGLDRCDLFDQLVAVVVLVLVGAPRLKYSTGEFEPLLAEGLLLGEPF